MLAWLIQALVPALADDALKALFGFISSEMSKRNLIKEGQAQQAAAETAQSAKTEAAMAQAIQDAPTSKGAALKRLEDGNA
jgi:hypothetical protein